jgi:hypothetical protein
MEVYIMIYNVLPKTIDRVSNRITVCPFHIHVPPTALPRSLNQIPSSSTLIAMSKLHYVVVYCIVQLLYRHRDESR